MQSRTNRREAFPNLLALACVAAGSVLSACLAPAEESLSAPSIHARETIARCEDARSDGGGELQSLLQEGEIPIRERAAFALGRIPFPDGGAALTDALCGAVKDPSSEVRAAAAFALGMRADTAAAEALLEARSDPDARVRARVIEAASRIDDPRLRRMVLDALTDASETVRAEAAVGPSRWKRDAPDAEAVDAALAEKAGAAGDGEVAWRALYSLARRRSASGRSAFEAALSSTDVRARIFAAQGLKAVPVEGANHEKLRAALADADWRVACEAALALGEHPAAAAVPALERALGHRNSLVRRCAAEALGRFKDAKEAVQPGLARAEDDASVDVRCAVLVARARLEGDALAAEVERAASSGDALLRAGAADAAGFLGEATGVPLLLRLTRDPEPRVADVAAHALKGHPTLEARARLVEMLADKDNGLRLAAADVLKEIGGAEDLGALARCLASSRGEISAEIAATIVDAAARIGGEPAREILERGSFHPDAFVRRKARALFLAQFPGTEIGIFRRSSSRAAVVPVPGADYPASGPNPRVEIVTNRGRMVFELLRDEAPVHVFNFLALARRGVYSGTTFHRVVPDFVIQGGDPRGDGNGGTSWRGEPLRNEFTPRKFVRGSLGMPRNDDPDSGGGQIFVTHRETPHLDGRYTLFGELREGFEVLDSIQLGDTIKSVRDLGLPGDG